jgi:hypothetical protein
MSLVSLRRGFCPKDAIEQGFFTIKNNKLLNISSGISQMDGRLEDARLKTIPIAKIFGMEIRL